MLKIADKGKRIVSAIIDIIIISIIQSSIVFILLLLQSFNMQSIGFLDLEVLINSASLITLILFLLKDVVKGRSIGKRIMKITVRDSANSEIMPSTIKLITRNIFLIFWPIEFLIFLVNNKNQRFGDKVMKTNVYFLEHNNNIQSSEL